MITTVERPARLTRACQRIDEADWNAAQHEYRPNCGPFALAVMTGLKLMEVLPHIPEFKARHFTNPTMMQAALRALGVTWRERDDTAIDGKPLDGKALTRYGICRLQWAGPWTKPGANPMWAYRHTHWIGAAENFGWIGHPREAVNMVYDVNFGWQTEVNWKRDLVRGLIKECADKRATGDWWATHRWELFT